MTETELELARELARHPAWRWLEGMLACDVTQGDEDLKARVHDSRVTVSRFADGDPVEPHHYPDLSDPATQGCLIAMLGEHLHTMARDYYLERWDVWVSREPGEEPGPNISGTLGEALARAWLAVNHD